MIKRLIITVVIRFLGLIQRDLAIYLPAFGHLVSFETILMLLRICEGDAVKGILRFFGAAIGENVRINAPLIIHNADGSFANLRIEDNCHIGRDVFLDLADTITIERNVTVSMRCTILTHFDAGDSHIKQFGYQKSQGPVLIREGAYLGCGVTVLAESTIGKSALVAAAAVVRGEIQPAVLVAGAPARIVKTLCE